MKQKLVSIIIPVYNVKVYLSKCIDSVLKQTYKNIEVILIDDCSNDGSEEICDYYSKLDERIIVIHKKNEGVSRARNLGIDIAKGEYIAFIDSDDYIKDSMIEDIISEIEKNKCDMGICGYSILYEDGKEKISDKKEEKLILNSKETLKEIFSTNKINGFLWNKVFSKTLLDKIRLKENLEICEDLHFVCNILKNELKICYIGKALYYYRNISSSATKNIKKIFTANGELKYLKAYKYIEILYKDDKEILEKIKLRKVKTVLESYRIVINNSYYDCNLNKNIFNFLNLNKTDYMLNNKVNLKLKLAFIIFYFISFFNK